MSGWATAAQVATTIGATVGVGSLTSGIYFYRRSKEDSYASEFRRTLTRTLSAIERLDQLITHEMASEMANTVVYSRDFNSFFTDAHAAYGQPQEEFELFLKKFFDMTPILVPIHTPLTETYEHVLTDIEPAMTRYQMDFPGAYRVTRTASEIFSSILRRYKTVARDEDLWRLILAELKRKDEAGSSTERLRERFAIYLAIGIGHQAERSQKDIDDILKILEIVVTAYLGISDKDLILNRREAAKIALKPWAETETYAEELYEDEKALRRLLGSTHEQDFTAPIFEYHKRVAAFEERRRRA